MKGSAKYLMLFSIFIIGLSLILYPTVSNYLYEKNSSSVIMNYQEAVDEFSQEDLQAEMELAHAYNQSLIHSGIILTDPYDADRFPVTDGKYSEMLTIGGMMAYIEIPKISVYLPVYHGTDEETLKNGVGHLENSSLPVGGEETHSVLTGHTGLPSADLFTDLNLLEVGDYFFIYVLGKTLSYQVDQVKVILPDEIEDLIITENDNVTLLTCTPYGVNSHRLIVRGERVEITRDKVTGEAVPVTQTDSFKESAKQALIVAGSTVAAVLITVAVIRLAGRKKRKRENS